MVTIIDVIRKLSIDLQEKYPKYALKDRDLNDTIDRPCMFIDIDDMTSSMPAVGYVQDTNNLELYVFCEDLETGFLECLDRKNELLDYLGNPIEVTGEDDTYTILSDNLTCEISKADKALKISFTVDLIQELPQKDKDLPFMEELEVH